RPHDCPNNPHSGHTWLSQVPCAPPASTRGAPPRLHGSRTTRPPTYLHTDPPLSSPPRSTSATEILEIGEFSRISAHVRSHAEVARDRKSTRLNSSHVSISYAVFCLKTKKKR